MFKKKKIQLTVIFRFHNSPSGDTCRFCWTECFTPCYFMLVLDAVSNRENSPLLQNTCRSESPSRQETRSGPRACCGTGERISLVGLERLEEARRRFGQGDLDASKPDGWNEKKTTSLINCNILWNVGEKLWFKTWIGSISGAFFGSPRRTIGKISLKHN